jgi:hypothetical protein
MGKPNVFIQFADKIQFELFGIFLNGSRTTFPISKPATLQYECTLDDYQLLIAKTQFKATVTEL